MAEDGTLNLFLIPYFSVLVCYMSPPIFNKSAKKTPPESLSRASPIILSGKGTQHCFQILQKYGFCKKVGVSSQTHSLSIYPQRELTTVTPRNWIMIETPLLRQYLRYLIVTFTFTTTQTLQSGVDVSQAWDGNMKHGAALLSWSPASSLYHQNILPFKVKVGAGNAVSQASSSLNWSVCSGHIWRWGRLLMRASSTSPGVSTVDAAMRCSSFPYGAICCHLLTLQSSLRDLARGDEGRAEPSVEIH